MPLCAVSKPTKQQQISLLSDLIDKPALLMVPLPVVDNEPVVEMTMLG